MGGWSWLTSDLTLRIAASVAGAVGLALLAWAVAWDRSRGQRRCPRCWHSMEGLPAGISGWWTCPECGRVVRRERGMKRTRRRWRWVVVGAVLVVACAGGWVWPVVRSGGWVRALPDRVLIELMPWMEERTGPPWAAPSTRGEALYAELRRRVIAGALSGAELDMVHRRAVRLLERRSRRPSLPLIDSLDDPMWNVVRWGLRDGELSSDAVTNLIEIRAARAIHLREAWPEGTRPRAHLELDAVIPSLWGIEPIILLPRTAEARSYTDADMPPFRSSIRRILGQNSEHSWEDWSVAVGVPEADATSIEFDVIVGSWSRDPLAEIEDSIAVQMTISKPFRWVRSVEEAVHPVDDATRALLGELIEHEAREALGERFGSTASFRLDLSGWPDPDVVPALRVSWMIGEHPIYSCRVWDCPIDGPSRLRAESWLPLWGQVYPLMNLAQRWHLRIEGDPELALRHPTARSYWDGVIDIPLREVIGAGKGTSGAGEDAAAP